MAIAAHKRARAKKVKLSPRPVPERDIARIFMHGRSQAVRLPKAFRLPGDRVRVRREGANVVLEPLAQDFNTLWAEIDRLRGGELFMPEGRQQPPMPPDDDVPSFD